MLQHAHSVPANPLIYFLVQEQLQALHITPAAFLSSPCARSSLLLLQADLNTPVLRVLESVAGAGWRCFFTGTEHFSVMTAKEPQVQILWDLSRLLEQNLIPQ